MSPPAPIPSFIDVPLDEIPQIRAELQAGFDSGKTKDIAFRKDQLLALGDLINENLDLINSAFAQDLGRHPAETNVIEITTVLSEIKFAYDNVARWAKPTSTPFHPAWVGMNPKVHKEPLGVLLIISPFNYPILLALNPLVGAIAAGNAVVLKPSEQTPAISAVIADLFPKYLDQSLYRVVNGGIPETTKLLELPWGHIFYTGNGNVARIILTAAAKTLTPVSTELGGKSPVFIDPKCDLKTSVKRLMWGKTLNAGQTCTAPDYALVPRDFVDQFVQACVDVHVILFSPFFARDSYHIYLFVPSLKEFYPNGVKASESYGRIVSPAHARRLQKLLDNTKGKIAHGGTAEPEERYIEPTIVIDVKGDDSLMSEELFGPIFPVIAIDSLEEGIAFVNERDHPLTLHIFSKDAAYKAKVLNNTQSGSVSINDTIVSYGVVGAPFGGIGPSGSGAYKGKYSFDAFSHHRTVIDNPAWTDLIMSERYPPYTAGGMRKMDMLAMPSLPSRRASNKHWTAWIVAAIALVGGLVGVRQRTSS
ncbi:NAD-aldehyde dehydrogenase [Amylostereum chailletii]|nr:NAD-aldehyde dehydrogenase [Amylostereum chailletii]